MGNFSPHLRSLLPQHSITNLQFAKLLDSLLPPLNGRVSLELQVFQVPFQLLLSRCCQSPLLPFIFQFCLILMQLSQEEGYKLQGWPSEP